MSSNDSPVKKTSFFSFGNRCGEFLIQFLVVVGYHQNRYLQKAQQKQGGFSTSARGHFSSGKIQLPAWGVHPKYQMMSIRKCFSSFYQGSLNGTFFLGIKQCKYMVTLREFPCLYTVVKVDGDRHSQKVGIVRGHGSCAW